MNIKGSKHLTLNDRHYIQVALEANEKVILKEIAENIGKDERTVSKEIKAHRLISENKRANYGKKEKYIQECKKLNRFPFVCNGCELKRGCHFKHNASYDAIKANDEYKTTLTESRSGVDLTLEQKIKLDTALKNGVEKGQSVYHILSTNKDIDYSVRSVYRLIDKGETVIQNIDLIRKVKLKPRKHYAYDQTKDKSAIRQGRTYEDFIKFISENGYPSVVEIDTVEGPRQGKQKCLLTIHINIAHFTLAYLLDSKESKEVSKVFIHLQELLGEELYSKIFQVILTDRGSEFIDPLTIENSYSTNKQLTHVFFCNSYASYQKGSIEEDHELIRRVIFKGVSMNDLNQDKVDTMMSHVNSYQRQSIESTPYKIFESLYGKEVLNKLKIREITPDQVTLKPTILK